MTVHICDRVKPVAIISEEIGEENDNMREWLWEGNFKGVRLLGAKWSESYLWESCA